MHTPGPWFQFDDGGTLNASVEMTYGPAYADCVWGPQGPGHGVVADCSPNGQSATPTTIANARLIAAAPDVTNALENLLIGIAAGWEIAAFIADGRAALKKAGLS